MPNKTHNNQDLIPDLIPGALSLIDWRRPRISQRGRPR